MILYKFTFFYGQKLQQKYFTKYIFFYNFVFFKFLINKLKKKKNLIFNF